MARTRAITRYRTRYVSRPRHRSKEFTIPLGPAAALAYGLYPSFQNLIGGAPEQAWNNFIWRYTGFNAWDKTWQPKALMFGLVPLIAGLAVHKYIGGRLGVNRMLKQSGIPILRI